MTVEQAPAPATQNARVLKCLTDHANAWVSMPELAKACTVSGIGVPVHSRISDLREVGFLIEHKNEWVKRQCHSFYRLVRQGAGASYKEGKAKG